MTKFEQHITIESNDCQLIEQLVQACSEKNLSINQIKSAINKGALWLTRGKYTQRVRKVKKPLNQGDCLHFYYDEKVLNQTPSAAKLIADMEGYSVWYKPYGMLSQGSKWSDHCTITRWAEIHLQPQRPSFIVHRLDRAASGLIILAHSKKMAQKFSQIFENHLLKKRYQIIVHGQLPSQFNSQIGKEVTESIDNKKAKSTFYQGESNKDANLSLINVNIETGRKHQIRKHAAYLGVPVVGDRLHGGKQPKLTEELNLQLCAVALEFDCPINHEMQHISLPEELRPNLTKLIALLNKVQ